MSILKRAVLLVAFLALTQPAWAISHWQDVVMVGRPLVPVAGASVTVYLQGTTTKATIYSDRAGGVSLANPVTTDSNGVYSFYVAEGRYDLLIVATGVATTTRSDVGIFDWSASPIFTNLIIGGVVGAPGSPLTITANTGQNLNFGADNSASWQITTAGGLTPRVTDNSLDFGGAVNRLHAGYFGTSVIVGTNPATVGAIRLANNTFLMFRNAANTVDVNGLTLDGSNVLFLGDGGVSKIVLNAGATDIQWGKALVALGGGAAPTVGTIGGGGPASAAQNSWMRVLDSTGAAFWVPVWK